MTPIENQTLALAGVFQSAVLIEQLATSGEINNAAFDCCYDSLFTFDSQTTIDVFGDLAGLTRGMQALSEYLGGNNQQSGKNIAYYVLSMLKIAGELKRRDELANQIQTTLENIQTQAREFDFSRGNIIAKIDGLYQNTVSTINPRIIVRGDQNYLRNPDNVSKVRTLLFAGIRASVLWHQLGGSKLKLVFSRKKYVTSAQQFLDRV